MRGFSRDAISRAKKASVRAFACSAIAIGKKLNPWAPPGYTASSALLPATI